MRATRCKPEAKVMNNLITFREPAMKVWEINNFICYGSTAEMGLGVFASMDIAPNSLILQDPVRSFDPIESALLKRTSAYHLLFVDRETYAGKDNICRLHLVVGPISMINHNSEANCNVEWNIAEDRDYLANASLVANRHIKAGEEIFIDYLNVEEYEFYSGAV
jgi:SET domain-containing protein